MTYKPSSDAEAELVAALRANLLDDELRGVYADFLEAHGQLERAQLLRAETASLQPGVELVVRVDKLSPPQDHGWRTLTSRAPISRCDAFVRGIACPGRWDMLALGSKDAERRCNLCERTVRYCISDPAAKRAGRERVPVVLDSGIDQAKALAAYDGPIRWNPHRLGDDELLDD